MARSLKKGPYINPKIHKKALAAKSEGASKVIKIWDRAATIAPEYEGLTFGVHNGKQHIPVYITEEMVGRKFGEFSHTRIFKGHGGKLAKGQK